MHVLVIWGQSKEGVGAKKCTWGVGWTYDSNMSQLMSVAAPLP